jgi:restriction endonuclease
MALAKLDFVSMPQLADGKVNKLLQRHLQRAAEDCMDRPGDKSARKVVIEYVFVPQVGQDGDCEKVICEVECKTKVPVYRSVPIQMRPTKGGFLFNPDFADDLDAQSLFEDD